MVFGTILFPNVDGLVDLATIDAFLAYHHSKESPVIVVLANAYDTFDLRCKKSSARIVCCTPALYVWLVSHVFRHEGRPVCPLQGHSMCTKKGKANWEELLAGMVGASINWFPRWKEGGAGVLCSCEGFPNIPLMGMRGCINYNLMLVIRQLGYPMRGVPSEKILQRIRRAWNTVERKDKELRGSSNGVIGGYHKWLKSRTQGITWLPKLKGLSGKEAEVLEESEEVQALKVELEKMRVVKEALNMVVTRVWKKCDVLRDVNMTMVEALERKNQKGSKGRMEQEQALRGFMGQQQRAQA